MDIHQLTLPTQNLNQQLNFYEHTLALPILQRDENAFTVQAGTSQLTFQTAETAGIYHLAFNISPSHFAQSKTWLEERLTLLTAPSGKSEFHFESWNADACYFLDADGNILEFIARYDLPPVQDFQILSISEFGIAAPDVSAAIETIQSKLWIIRYKTSCDNETFCALGDEKGLLIMVKQGRMWFPDEAQPANLAPFQIEVMDESKQHYRISGYPLKVEEVKP